MGIQSLIYPSGGLTCCYSNLYLFRVRVKQRPLRHIHRLTRQLQTIKIFTDCHNKCKLSRQLRTVVDHCIADMYVLVCSVRCVTSDHLNGGKMTMAPLLGKGHGKHLLYGRHWISQHRQIILLIEEEKKEEEKRVNYNLGVTCSVSPVPCNMSLMPTATATDPFPANSPSMLWLMLRLILT